MISIVIPTYNQAKHLQKVLIVLKEQLRWTALESEIIVVDNGSADNTAIVISQYDVKYVRYIDTISPFAARNRGVKECTHRTIAFLDTKCIPKSTYIPTLSKLVKDSTWDIIAGQITPVGINARTSLFSVAYALLHLKTDPVFFDGKVSALTGNMLVRRSVFSTLGGFDVGRSGGDIDFSERAREMGYSMQHSRKLAVEYSVKSKSEVISFLKRVSKDGFNQRNLLSLRPPNPTYINSRLEDIDLQLSPYRYFQLYLTIWYIRWLKYIYQYI